MDQIKSLQKAKSDNDFLLWAKIDKMGDLIELMAQKLHEAGVINGDLDEVKREYRAAEDKYEDHLRNLAAVVLRK